MAVPADFFERVTQLKRDGLSFTTVTVVSRRAPVSSHLGDRAIVFADGRMEGFVGGSCSREIVRKQALEALRLGKPRLVLIRPDATLETLQHAADAESIVVPMTCASEGAVDVYLEPHARARVLLVAGFTPVAEKVASLAGMLEYEVVRVVTREELRDLELSGIRLVALNDLAGFLEQQPEAARSSMAAVVASQGHYDEPALEALLNAQVGFVGLLASRKRAATVRELLELQGMDSGLTAQIRNPVGLDIDAKTPGEVAVSILAEVIQARAALTPRPPLSPPSARARLDGTPKEGEKDKKGVLESSVLEGTPSRTQIENAVLDGVSRDPGSGDASGGAQHASTQIVGLPSERDGYAISPVDGEEVEIATAIHLAQLEGVTYYFTCPNCKRRFLKNPAQYLEKSKLEPKTVNS
jgi:xanthine dehydrogenase accessory factor